MPAVYRRAFGCAASRKKNGAPGQGPARWNFARGGAAPPPHGWGADVVFEASGNANAYAGIVDLLCPNGCLVLVGMPLAPVPLDVVSLQAKEARIESVFRYANVFPRALALIASGAIDVKPFISRTFPFSDGLRAFEAAASGQPHDVKIQIEMD